MSPRNIDPERAWDPYVPDAERPWDLRRVAHLYRRAAFGPSPAELDRAHREGPERAIDRLVRPAGDLAAFHREYDGYEAAVAGEQDAHPLRAWWLRRMLATPDPLREKMALFWHGYFAIGNQQVSNARLMRAHVACLRAGALGTFGALLAALVEDPALALGCGDAASRKARPGTGLARALLENYTVGPGEFTPGDLDEVARALTGRFVLRGELRFFAREHDGGPKEILGARGPFGAADAARLCAAHPATARRLVGALYRWLIAEDEDPTEALLAPLVRGFARDLDTGALVERMLRSELFFSERTIHRKIKSPVEFALGIAKTCGGMIPTEPLARDLAALGQDLYHPPTPRGWIGGVRWVHAGTWVKRCALARALLATAGPYGGKLDPAALAADPTSPEYHLA